MPCNLYRGLAVNEINLIKFHFEKVPLPRTAEKAQKVFESEKRDGNVVDDNNAEK